MTAATQRIAVIGVGLIGGSIGMAARERLGASVCGYDADPEVLRTARERGALDAIAEDVEEAVGEADAVFVATPVGRLEELVRAALAAAGSDCVISDVGSTKRAVLAAASDQRFVGGHPLAGAEGAGVTLARADMFEGATWYLTPAARTSGVLYERLHRILVALGAHPTAIDAAEHDRLMACVSHLPHVLANVLVGEAAELVARDAHDADDGGGARGGGAAVVDGEPEEPRVAGSGRARSEGGGVLFAAGGPGPSFRDATRVAGANSAIWTDIYLSNRSELDAAIARTIAALEGVRKLLAEGRPENVRAWNEGARQDKERLATGSGAGEPPLELRVTVPNRPGVIAEIALALGRAGVNIADMALSPSPDNSQGVIALWVRGADRAAAAERLVARLGFPTLRVGGT